MDLEEMTEVVRNRSAGRMLSRWLWQSLGFIESTAQGDKVMTQVQLS